MCFYSHLSFWNLGCHFSNDSFHPLCSTILIVPFCLLFRTIAFLFETYAAYPHLFHPLLVTTKVITIYWMWRYFYPVSCFSATLIFFPFIVVPVYVANEFAYLQPNPQLLYNCILDLLGNSVLVHRQFTKAALLFLCHSCLLSILLCQCLVVIQFALHSRFTK